MDDGAAQGKGSPEALWRATVDVDRALIRGQQRSTGELSTPPAICGMDSSANGVNSSDVRMTPEFRRPICPGSSNAMHHSGRPASTDSAAESRRAREAEPAGEPALEDPTSERYQTRKADVTELHTSWGGWAR